VSDPKIPQPKAQPGPDPLSAPLDELPGTPAAWPDPVAPLRTMLDDYAGHTTTSYGCDAERALHTIASRAVAQAERLRAALLAVEECCPAATCRDAKTCPSATARAALNIGASGE
jgi:hypothetical protein